MVTHDFDAVAPLVDRVVVLARGRIAHDAPAPTRALDAALADVYRAAARPRDARCRVSDAMRALGLLLWKDVLVELRAKELVYATVFFAAVVLLVFSFAFLGGPRPTVDVAAGVLWVAIALAGTLGISRAFEREREGDTHARAVALAGAALGLYLSSWRDLAADGDRRSGDHAVDVAAVRRRRRGARRRSSALLLLGTIGFAAVAALFGASLGRARSRDLLLPLLVYPIVVPVLIAGTRGTRRCSSAPTRRCAVLAQFLLVFDAIFVSLGVWVFEPLVAGDA